MIKFFRKIRQNMINENKTGKYLKYAIGEIVLVVIGILIALSINNWNDSRKDNLREQAYYKTAINDLINDTILINEGIHNNTKSFDHNMHHAQGKSSVRTRSQLQPEISFLGRESFAWIDANQLGSFFIGAPKSLSLIFIRVGPLWITAP